MSETIDPSGLKTMSERLSEFRDELRALINRHGIENHSDTPDYIIAQFLVDCLLGYTRTVRGRDAWFGFDPWGDDHGEQP
jgi:hypothetical protein